MKMFLAPRMKEELSVIDGTGAPVHVVVTGGMVSLMKMGTGCIEVVTAGANRIYPDWKEI